MTTTPGPHAMKPETAARKLGIFLPAAPAEFRDGAVTREELKRLQSDPPPWLVELRREGPHPRQEVARKLGVSTSGLARAGVTEALTTAEIRQLLDERPEWLEAERERQAEVRAENARLKARAAERREAEEPRGGGAERLAPVGKGKP